ncbi:MAG: hybrid sensor histidine kinase/response regulator [Bdellovibrionaceae bacterium]|nr:hybrid sensor histidine kinase/response regulator [Pseudobdellovibrionaceae bacterium]MBX3034398.1 hybrid sensor histidine kinase/response regulator [Pseudobdellovibrionaceae bacterium]
MKQTILCVDDETDNVDALERLFRKKFQVLRATSGQEALKVLSRHQGPVAAIITDQRMPEMTGSEFLERTLQSHPDTVRLLLTGYTDLDSVINAVNKGQIFRYLTKPWDPVDLANTVDRAVERFELGQELKQRNAELAVANEELKNLDKAKSNFMILVNHELKTPLTTVLNFTGLLSETTMDEEQRLYVDRIQKSGERLKVLIEDVLLVVKAETGQLKSDRRETKITSFLAELPPDVVKIAADKNQSLKEDLAPLPVKADPGQIRQVLQRLVHNAVKFGRDNSEILLESAADGEDVVFSVTNHGDTISKQVIAHIFRPFFIDEDIMNHSTGMGLGLTICQSLLRVHGSVLDIRNRGDGVTVSFRLPAV